MDLIRKFISRPATLAIIGFILGLATDHIAFSNRNTRAVALSDSFSAPPAAEPALPEDLIPDSFFKDPFAGFQQMHKMQSRLQKEMESQFGNFPALAVTNDAKLSVREDEKFIYYDIAIPDLKEKQVQVRVENGEVQIRGESKKQFGDDAANGFMSSSFQKSFPWPDSVPQDLDPTKVKIEYKDNHVSVLFPKEAMGVST